MSRQGYMNEKTHRFVVTGPGSTKKPELTWQQKGALTRAANQAARLAEKAKTSVE